MPFTLTFTTCYRAVFYYFRLQKPLSTIHIALVSPSLCRTSAPIQFTIVLGVLGTQELEKLRAAHEDLQKENESLRAQQISPAQDGFEPPCLKCIERDNATSVAECSTAATVSLSSTTDVVTNPSAEDTTTIADENARLKILLETGMYKSLKGHQTLCDVLKKQILN